MKALENYAFTVEIADPPPDSRNTISITDVERRGRHQEDARGWTGRVEEEDLAIQNTRAQGFTSFVSPLVGSSTYRNISSSNSEGLITARSYAAVAYRNSKVTTTTTAAAGDWKIVGKGNKATGHTTTTSPPQLPTNTFQVLAVESEFLQESSGNETERPNGKTSEALTFGPSAVQAQQDPAAPTAASTGTTPTSTSPTGAKAEALAAVTYGNDISSGSSSFCVSKSRVFGNCSLQTETAPVRTAPRFAELCPCCVDKGPPPLVPPGSIVPLQEETEVEEEVSWKQFLLNLSKSASLKIPGRATGADSDIDELAAWITGEKNVTPGKTRNERRKNLQRSDRKSVV